MNTSNPKSAEYSFEILKLYFFKRMATKILLEGSQPEGQ